MVYRKGIASVNVIFCVLLEFPFVEILNCFKETAESYGFRDNVFETCRKRLELLALFPT